MKLISINFKFNDINNFDSKHKFQLILKNLKCIVLKTLKYVISTYLFIIYFFLYLKKYLRIYDCRIIYSNNCTIISFCFWGFIDT